MTWLLIAYLFALLYLATHKEKLARATSLRAAWISFALIPLSHFLFALFRAGNLRSPRDIAMVEVWADGIAWLLLGISFLFLTGAVAPDRTPPGDSAHTSNLPPPL